MQENAHRGNALENELRQGLDLVTEKWTILVMHVLKGGTRRLSDLQREIEGISQKMLIQTLRKTDYVGMSVIGKRGVRGRSQLRRTFSYPSSFH